MRKLGIFFVFFLISFALSAQADYSDIFDKAYKMYPQIPRGCLEAVAYNNTHVKHLNDNDYSVGDSTDMPRSYGVMGLVLEGKGYFRNNLLTISKLSGISVQSILNSPDSNIIAYSAAFAQLSKRYFLDIFNDRHIGIENFKRVFIELSELPLPDGDVDNDFVLNTMLYSVYYFLNNDELCKTYHVNAYSVDFNRLFGSNLKQLSSPKIYLYDEYGNMGGGDYDNAIWRPAPDCNYSSRNGSKIQGIVIHYTEGSYAGTISWFLNCDSHVSAHYIIRSIDGQVTQMVKERDMAFQARSANCYTIGIEHEAYGDIASYFTTVMYKSSADLVKNICMRNPQILPYRMFYRDTLDDGTVLDYGLHPLGDSTACIMIRGHQHYPGQSHTDPGPYWNWNYYYKLVNDDIDITEYDSIYGLFSDGGGLNGNYDNDERKGYLIQVDGADSIVLTFINFNLEKDNDFIWVYDGPSFFSPLIGRWNTHNPGRICSSGNSIFVEFRSDCDINYSGWAAAWQAYMPKEYNDSLIIVSPNPVIDNANIIVPKYILPVYLYIYDLLGNIINKEKFISVNNTLNISYLPHGVYLLKFTHGKDNIRTIKILK